jgi:hypothetical protein
MKIFSFSSARPARPPENENFSFSFARTPTRPPAGPKIDKLTFYSGGRRSFAFLFSQKLMQTVCTNLGRPVRTDDRKTFFCSAIV